MGLQLLQIDRHHHHRRHRWCPSFLFSECVREMHGLAAMVKMGAIPIHDYIRDNYSPTLDSTAAQHFCEDSLSKYYVGMLFGVVEHYFVDGALHVCQTAGTCSAREYTCDECIQGLEWVEMYLEDPIMIAEFRIYLEQNFCLSGRLQGACGGALHRDARDG